MAIDPADRFQDAEEFKKALLGAKSKTQRLAGNYTVPPAPIDDNNSYGDLSDDEPERPSEKKPGLMAVEPQNEFKPPKRRKKKRKGQKHRHHGPYLRPAKIERKIIQASMGRHPVYEIILGK